MPCVARRQRFIQHLAGLGAILQLVQVAPFVRHLADQTLGLCLQTARLAGILVRLKEEVLRPLQDGVKIADRFAESASASSLRASDSFFSVLAVGPQEHVVAGIVGGVPAVALGAARREPGSGTTFGLTTTWPGASAAIADTTAAAIMAPRRRDGRCCGLSCHGDLDSPHLRTATVLTPATAKSFG